MLLRHWSPDNSGLNVGGSVYGLLVCLKGQRLLGLLYASCVLWVRRVLTPVPCPWQMAKLRSLLSSAENEPPVPLVGNWRPPQPIRGRVVRASFKWVLSGRETCHWRAWFLASFGAPNSKYISVFTLSNGWEMHSPRKPGYCWQEPIGKHLAFVIIIFPIKVAFLVRFQRRQNRVYTSKDIENGYWAPVFSVILNFPEVILLFSYYEVSILKTQWIILYVGAEVHVTVQRLHISRY